MGSEWLMIANESGQRRLDDEADFVRVEIETALQRSIPVIPVLLGHARIPKSDELPASMANFAFCNGTRVRPDPDFHHDVEGLIRALNSSRTVLPRHRVNSIGMKLALIQPGKFLMGASEFEPERDADERPQHEVTITKPFYMGVFQVTQREYQSVMGNNPSYFKGGWFRAGGPDHPVDRVAWEDAIQFCKRMSGLAAEKQAGLRYRLPTEAEWEYACRARTQTAFSFGDSLSSDQANFDGHYPYGCDVKGPFHKATTKLEAYSPNAFGLYDMHGNVWELCGDRYGAGYYANSPAVDPQGPSSGEFHVLRGGSWNDEGQHCRASYRRSDSPHSRHQDDHTGFRVVCLVDLTVSE
jgi:formylglycine-generating enzyme required for sulfatase activity